MMSQLLGEAKTDEEFDEMTKHLWVFLGGAFESTALSLSSIFYFLYKNPKDGQKIQQEATIAMQKSNSEILTSEILDEIVYASYVVKEGLRLDGFTFNSFTNKALEDFEVDGISIGKDTLLVYNLAAIHRNPNHWQYPDEFLPERFDPSSPLSKRPDGKTGSSYSYIPFSCGPRVCPGNILANLELKIFTIVFAMNWVFEIDESHFKPGTPSFGLLTQDKLIAKIK